MSYLALYYVYDSALYWWYWRTASTVKDKTVYEELLVFMLNLFSNITCACVLYFREGKTSYLLFHYLFPIHTLFIRVSVPFLSSSDSRPLQKLSMDWEWEDIVWHSSSKEQSLSRQIFISFSNLDNSPVTASSIKERERKKFQRFWIQIDDYLWWNIEEMVVASYLPKHQNPLKL